MKPTLATIGTILTLGAGTVTMDAVALNETPIEHTARVAEMTVEVKQIENTVEATIPWKDQPGIRVKYDLGEPTLAERIADKRKQAVVTEVVPFAESEGFKVDIILNERPASNCFEYQIEGWENYDFFYQPPLTDEEIAEGATRPEEIVGSYAVYHKTLNNHQLGETNYETGKFAHIPYPYVWEVENATATKQRAESFTIENGLMTVCVSQKFIDQAIYPVRVDPTFGYTSNGASASANNNFLSGTQFALPANSFLVDIYANAYVVSVTADGITQARASVYLASDNSFVANTYENTTLTATDDFYNFPFSASVSVSADTYWLLLNGSNDGDQIGFGFDTDVGVIGSRVASTYPTFPNPYVPSADNNRNYSIYATYCVTGEACGPVVSVFNSTSSNLWTVPTGVTSANMACWGGGGGGDVISTSGGGGGGGGAFASTTVTVVPGAVWSIFVGAGGDGQTTPTSGGNSSIANSGGSTSTLAAGGTFANGTTGGAGGTTANSSGTVEYAGGAGGNGNTTGDVGGGGGGAAGPNAAGGAGAAGASSLGGGGGGSNNGASGDASGVTGGTGANGGANGGNAVSGAAGQAGNTGANGGGGGGGGDDTFSGGLGGSPGGGGGGAEAVAGTSGDGAPGQCTITYTIAAAGGGGTTVDTTSFFLFE